jgi:hypothetical protein
VRGWFVRCCGREKEMVSGKSAGRRYYQREKGFRCWNVEEMANVLGLH